MNYIETWHGMIMKETCMAHLLKINYVMKLVSWKILYRNLATLAHSMQYKYITNGANAQTAQKKAKQEKDTSKGLKRETEGHKPKSKT